MNIHATENRLEIPPEAPGAPSAQPSLPPDPPPETTSPPGLINPQPQNLSNHHDFQRFPGDTPRAFSAFGAWLNLGQSRSLPALAGNFGENLGTLKNWSSRFQWNQRLQSFNEGLLQNQVHQRLEFQQKHAAGWAERLNRFREQEWDAAQKLLSVAQCFLESFGDEQLARMTLTQVSRALSISSSVARSAIAGAELPPGAGPVLSPAQQQMLDALKRL